MNIELMEALTILEKEKNISKDVMMDAIENSLISACKNHFGTSDNIKVIMDRDTCDYAVYAEKNVVEEVEDPALEISLEEAEKLDSALQVGDIAQIPVHSKEFGRIATQNAKNLILQKIREEERKVVFDQYFEKEKDIVTGVVQRYVGKNISINLGRADAMLTENEQVKGEHFKPTERIKLYVVEVKNTPKGPKILVSRTHPELVKRLFEAEVAEVRDGTVEIKSIARVIVPDYQLSLAIGKEGQNARLAARLTGYKIDIKSETQAIEAGELPENYMEEMGLVGEEGYTGDYEEEYNEEYSEESYDEAAEDQNEESEEIEFIETENE